MGAEHLPTSLGGVLPRSVERETARETPGRFAAVVGRRRFFPGQMQMLRSGSKPLNPTAAYVVVYAPVERKTTRSPSPSESGSS